MRVYKLLGVPSQTMKKTNSMLSQLKWIATFHPFLFSAVLLYLQIEEFLLRATAESVFFLCREQILLKPLQAHLSQSLAVFSTGKLHLT